MQLDAILAQFHDQLTAAAGLGDDRTREIAAALATAATPAVRLAILSALSAAADETTAALLDHPGSPAVSMHLDGDNVRVGVSRGVPATPGTRTDDGDASARISLRLSEALKTRIDEAAARDGMSVNTWLVRAASGALTPDALTSDPLTSDPLTSDPLAQFGAGFARLGNVSGLGGLAGLAGLGNLGGLGGFGSARDEGRPTAGGQHRVTGWIDG